LLMALASVGVEAGVVGQRLAARGGQPGGGLLDRPTGETIDDAGVLGVPFAEKPAQLFERLLLVDNAVIEVWTIIAGSEDGRSVEPELREDVLPRRRVGGRGQRDQRHPGKALAQHPQLLVIRAEIVPPLRDAMRLVDGEQGDWAARQQIEAAR